MLAYMAKVTNSVGSWKARNGDGIVQLLQLDIPVNGRDHFPPRVSWPFNEGLFHLFGRPPYRGDFFWFWEYQ